MLIYRRPKPLTLVCPSDGALIFLLMQQHSLHFLKNVTGHHHIKNNWSEEMVQWLNALAALAENLS